MLRADPIRAMKPSFKFNPLKPVTRQFWKVLRYIPKSLRQEIIRRKFEVTQQLPSNFVLKQAETKDEIVSALKLVYDSYLKLGYMDENEYQMRITKYQLLPTTIMLIIKIDDQVVGTLSIVRDSALGLPSEKNWNLGFLRKQGFEIAEISGLAIKTKSYHRGQLLLYLCKIMYTYCTELLRLDCIVAATSSSVEHFYTDLLLFETINDQPVAYDSVKGAPSVCGYLRLNQDLVENYRRIYAHRPIKQNIFDFFVNNKSPNIKLSPVHQCIQSYTVNQTLAYSSIIKEIPQLAEELKSNETHVYSTLDLAKVLPFRIQDRTEFSIHSRFETKVSIHLFSANYKEPIQGFASNVSFSGLKIRCYTSNSNLRTHDKVLLVIQHEANPAFSLSCVVVWIDEKSASIGCHAIEANQEWRDCVAEIEADFSLASSKIAHKAIA